MDPVKGEDSIRNPIAIVVLKQLNLNSIRYFWATFSFLNASQPPLRAIENSGIRRRKTLKLKIFSRDHYEVSRWAILNENPGIFVKLIRILWADDLFKAQFLNFKDLHFILLPEQNLRGSKKLENLQKE